MSNKKHTAPARVPFHFATGFRFRENAVMLSPFL